MLIELENITKLYDKLVALDNVSLQVQPGVVGLLGPNGAGKSTLINVLLGLTPITSGQGKVLGLDIRNRQRDIRRQTGYVPENDCFISGMSGVGYVCYTARLAAMDSYTAMQRAHEILDLVEMGEERYRPVNSYSAGMKQRIKLAQALVHDPDLILLDEPTNGLDPSGRKLMLSLIKELGRKGVSVFLSSHLLHDVEMVCEEVIVMGGGRVLTTGTVKQMCQPSLRSCMVRVNGDIEAFCRALAEFGIEVVNHDTESIELELPEDNRQDLILQAVCQSKVQLRGLKQQKSTLEQMFLKAIESQKQKTDQGT